MATPVRRSARLRSTTPASEAQKQAPKPSTKLISVAEREESQDLSEEAKKLMENIREDASRIKAQMIIEQHSQEGKNTETEPTLEVRKIAKARGKAGRFSNAHMAEFRKMDSITGHPSLFRARQDKIHPSPVKSSLKRTSSKACLDETSSPEKSGTVFTSPGKTMSNNPVKRSKSSGVASTPARVPLPKASLEPKPGQHGPRFLITPKKPMIARASSAKQINTTKIPSFPRSPSTKSIVTPRTPQTEFNPKLKTGLPSLTNLKSILRQRQPLFSTDPVKIAAGTHVAPPTSKVSNITSENKRSPTIRAVRTSEVQYHCPSLPNHTIIPHGIINKKRRRDENDDENIENKFLESSKEDERSQKRLKPNPTVVTNVHTPSPVKNSPMRRVAQGTGSHSRLTQKNRGVLTMSRLNMLSKPKARR
ncbi:predicted protein [Histoplasma mississippiense (nom. inval.)]|uniref:predicted protein n=1 Tax=Ajellomyces capsulatus (strain NAm1 / WU24) TaxID=2059318 RepID=UPI000157B435|nr:predicted protein [Histoplasma mississippiense (nom. inval.)]EDN02324.1 predicted protein [Histoplasma mississippiense (nom. inval.)]